MQKEGVGEKKEPKVRRKKPPAVRRNYLLPQTTDEQLTNLQTVFGVTNQTACLIQCAALVTQLVEEGRFTGKTKYILKQP